MTNPAENEHRSAFASTTGGVMTDEAGAITGDLELSCRPEADRLDVLVRYAGADEWYTVSGSPVRLQDGPDDALERITQHLQTPGPVVDGNETAVTLQDLPGP
jgi:hypothetical protein